MRKIIIILTIMLIMGVFSSHSIMGPAEAFGQSGRKVLMIAREGYSTDLDLMIKNEVGVMTTLLKEAGFEVDIASTSGQPILGPTQKIEKVLRLSEIKSADYVGIIMPCMAVGMFPGPPVSPEAVAIVKKSLADGKPVAAAANATIILAEGGILKGKKYAYATDPLNPGKEWPKRTDQRFQGGIYSGAGVVQDGKIITSGVCPTLDKLGLGKNETVELTQKFIAALGSK